MVCARRTIGSEVVLDAPNVPLGDEAQLKACWVHLEMVLILTQHGCAVYVECTIWLEIILDAPDGTPR